MTRTFVAGAALIALAACASPTPYQQAGTPGGYGFEQSQIEYDRYRISFSGNSLTDRDTVETYLLYRAAELTLENGYDYFWVTERATDEDTRRYGTGPDYYGPWRARGFFVNYRYYHPAHGWYGWDDPFWNPRHYREVTRYEANAEIVLGRGPAPDERAAFDARDVLENLGPDIVRPAPDA
ncbi:CC0125/CC1285 family lipoprotein [Hyphobacterium marinum]|uniref:Lipoprotein n=1 Tax=Hyphobacterium marinum TaxID=3116574 RepID=A0ABU7LUZ7_9PROT|nr:hypothetical protein [Hyphobacterium sp. Y6023]MEE2565306.1 hypothetical protein [Hyphobacterium sp. Y6023]